jgi:hypothetical protein
VFDVLRRSKPGDVVVSFLGPALLSEEQRNALGHGPRASVVAFCPGAIPTVLDLRRIAGMGLLHGAVLARTPVPSSGSPPGGSPGFDTLYRRADAKSLLEGTFMEPPR